MLFIHNTPQILLCNWYIQQCQNNNNKKCAQASLEGIIYYVKIRLLSIYHRERTHFSKAFEFQHATHYISLLISFPFPFLFNSSFENHFQSLFAFPSRFFSLFLFAIHRFMYIIALAIQYLAVFEFYRIRMWIWLVCKCVYASLMVSSTKFNEMWKGKKNNVVTRRCNTHSP